MVIEYPLLALRNIRKRGLRSVLTLLGIVIGITAVVALVALGQGLEQAITGQFSSLSTDRLVVTNAETGFGPPGSTSIKKLTQHDLEVIERIPDVAQVIPRLIRVARSEYNKVGRAEFIGSLPPKHEDMEKIFNIEDEIDLILVRVRDDADPEAVVAEITRKMLRDRGLKEGEEDFSVQTPLKVLGTVTTLLTGVQIVVSGIAAIALLVGTIGVANTLFTSVVERTREIGIMKS